MNDKLLRLLGLCRRAGKLIPGENAVGSAVRATKSVKLLVSANDVSTNSQKRAQSHTLNGKIPLLALPYDMITIGKAIGLPQCALAAITDQGLAEEIQKAFHSDSGVSIKTKSSP